ncbi:MAG TPA: isocitrate lyase/phosphoenolpyruvate mutase family protein [Woeseiaceae bacterium]|nr:isocitrate lyase/phosphoenolpyruvate mutase family protein [Woeseiaceae bacterium]
MSKTTEEKRAVFRQLHEQGSLVLPNPWDLGSLQRIEKLGAKAVASTSAGFAESRGREDYRMSREEVLAHLEEMCSATDLPLNADFESGFAESTGELSQSVELAIGTGIAGLSIEDRHGKGLFPEDVAVERLRTARNAIDKSGQDVMLVARCEGFLTGTAELPEVIDRLKAYAKAGGDVLYAPGASKRSDIKEIVGAVAPKPVNVLLLPGMQARDLFELGVCRVSTGSFLTDAAWRALESATRSVLEDGKLP